MTRKIISNYAYKNDYTVLRLGYFNYALLDEVSGTVTYHWTLLGVLLKIINNGKRAF